MASATQSGDVRRTAQRTARRQPAAGTLLLALLISLQPFAVISAARAADPDFDTYWHDGKAELDGYRFIISRYGQPRHGQGVLVYVTEPFSESRRVKVDDPAKNPADTFDAFKLNIVRDFQTGIYDYNTMVSVFTRSADFAPVKTSFSSAEWCGQVYEETLFFPDKITHEYFSYFEGETGQHTLTNPPHGVTEDALYISLRGLRGAFLAPGAATTVPFLPGPYFGRLNHKPLAWTTAEIQHLAAPQTVTVPAGTFACRVYTVKIAGGREGRFFVETDYPHRLVRWELLPDIAAELSGTLRLDYWKTHNNGDESYLKQLGIEPTVKP